MNIRFRIAVVLDPQDKREAAKVQAARQLLLLVAAELIKVSASWPSDIGIGDT